MRCLFTFSWMFLFLFSSHLSWDVLIEPAVQKGVERGGAHCSEVDAKEGEIVKPGIENFQNWKIGNNNWPPRFQCGRLQVLSQVKQIEGQPEKLYRCGEADQPGLTSKGQRVWCSREEAGSSSCFVSGPRAAFKTVIIWWLYCGFCLSRILLYFHMTWHMVTTWWPLSDHLVTTWSQHGHHMVTWWPLGDHMVTTWWPWWAWWSMERNFESCHLLSPRPLAASEERSCLFS